MKKPTEYQKLKRLLTSRASVSNNSKNLNILIFGAGLGGLAMIETLITFKSISIHAIVDIDENAPAFQLARKYNISTSTDSEKTLNSFEGNIVIDVTGDPKFHKRLLLFTQPHHIELISAKSAKLLFDLANKELCAERTLQTQNTKLNLLNSMLELTSQLENKPPLAEVLCTSLEHLHKNFSATKGLAIIAGNDESCKIAGCTGHRKSTCNQPACANIQRAFKDCSQGKVVPFLAGPIELHCSGMLTTYNIFLPVCQKNKPVAALLLDLPDHLTAVQEAMLSIASIHLDMTITTLESYRVLENMAIKDGLTGIFNRRYFDQELNKEVSRIRRSKHEALTCIFIDVDDFKFVNDSFGHSIGDIVLKEIANSISDAIRDYDTCARYGGDEFVVLMSTNILEGLAHLEIIAFRILNKISDICILDAPALNVSVSIGIAMQPSDTLNADTLLNNADHAVYQAKRANKSCFHIYTDTHLENCQSTGKRDSLPLHSPL